MNVPSDLADRLGSFAALLASDGRVLDVDCGSTLPPGKCVDDIVDRPVWRAGWWDGDQIARERVRKAVVKALEGRTVTIELRAQVGAATATLVDVEIAPLHDGEGQAARLRLSAATTADGTSVVPVADGLRVAADQVTDATTARPGRPLALAIVGCDYRIVHISQPFAALTGAPATALGAHGDEALPRFWPDLEPGLRHVFASGEPLVADVAPRAVAGAPWSDLRPVALHYSPLPGTDGTTRAVALMYEMTSTDMERRLDAYRREMEQRALRDPLTGLPSRALLADRARQAMRATMRTNASMALLMLDLDDFKIVNDTLGHSAGDCLLRELARRLRLAVRDVDTVGRLGGDEFAVVVAGIQNAAEAAAVAERILTATTVPFDLMGRLEMVRASIGIAVFPGDAHRLGGLFRSADLALYKAKRRGGQCASFFEPQLHEDFRSRQQLERSLRRAAEPGGLAFDLRHRHRIVDNRIAAVELEPVWEHPATGRTPLREALEVATRKGLAIQLAEQVMAHAGEVMTELNAGTRVLPLCVALAPPQIAETTIEAVVRALDRARVPADALQLELLTSPAWPAETATLRRDLERLVDMGVTVGLRGFGADHVAFRELRQLPVDRLILECDVFAADSGSAEADILLDTLAGLGRRLGKRVVASGVATRQQLEQLLAAGCEEAAGPVFAERTATARNLAIGAGEGFALSRATTEGG